MAAASPTDRAAAFEAERPRLLGIAARVLGSATDAEDVVQQAWLRLHGAGDSVDDIRSLPAWLTTVTTRLCLDQLRQRTTVSLDEIAPERSDVGETADPADVVTLADSVGVALHLVLERLSPRERVAFVLHDSFAVDFPTIATILGCTAPAARKLASRARDKVTHTGDAAGRADAGVVDAFLAAARHGDLAGLTALLAPDAVVAGDAAALLAGTPARLEGREAVAAMFHGGAAAALPVLIDGRPGAAWFHRGEARVAFDFTVEAGVVRRIDFRAEPAVLAVLVRRKAEKPSA